MTAPTAFDEINPVHLEKFPRQAAGIIRGSILDVSGR
jgi:hypothetical protein